MKQSLDAPSIFLSLTSDSVWGLAILLFSFLKIINVHWINTTVFTVSYKTYFYLQKLDIAKRQCHYYLKAEFLTVINTF